MAHIAVAGSPSRDCRAKGGNLAAAAARLGCPTKHVTTSSGLPHQASSGLPHQARPYKTSQPTRRHCCATPVDVQALWRAWWPVLFLTLLQFLSVVFKGITACSVCRQRRSGGFGCHHRRLRLCANLGGHADWIHCRPDLLRSLQIHLAPPAGSKRVLGLRALPPPPLAGSTPCLLQRQLRHAWPSEREHLWRSFNHFQLQREWDLYRSHPTFSWWPPFYLRRRSPVREVVIAHGLVLALAESGVCAAYDQDGTHPLCFLNVEADEVIRSLFVNRLTASLITVSVFSGDAFQRLRVRSTPLSCIRAGQPHAWRPLFDKEVLQWPGYVEFDDVNNVAVTCSAESGRIQVYDLRAPSHPLFFLEAGGICDVKIAAGGVMLLTHERLAGRQGELPLSVLDLNDGSCVRELRVPLGRSSSSSGACPGCGRSSPDTACPGSGGSVGDPPGTIHSGGGGSSGRGGSDGGGGGNGGGGGGSSGVGGGGGGNSGGNSGGSGGSGGGGGSGIPPGLDLVELFGRHLLVKEAGGPLLIHDIVSGSTRQLPAADFPPPAAFIHLPFNHNFLAFWQTGTAELWNFEGQRLASLAHAALPTSAAINTIFVSDSQDLMWVYCPPGGPSGSFLEATGIPAGTAGAAGQGSSYLEATGIPAGTAGAAAGEQRGLGAGGSGSFGGSRGGHGGGGGSAAEHALQAGGTKLGCIRVYDLVTGRQLAVVQQAQQQAQQQEQQQAQQGDARGCHAGAGSSKRQAAMAAAAAAALQHLTSLFYDRGSHRLYTGSADGRVQVWGM